MAKKVAIASDRGQSTVEWIGLLLLVALALATAAAISGVAIPGGSLANAIAERIVCAVGLECEPADPLERAYGGEAAELVREHAPTILYEPGMKALPVDYRSCREDACADGGPVGDVDRSIAGEATVAFVRLVDCRPGWSSAVGEGADCTGERSGNLYIQYWLYYPGSATAEGSLVPGLVRAITGGATHHRDDWESFTVRIGPAGVHERASSHHGYGSGWSPASGYYYVSGGSHAGQTVSADDPPDHDRRTSAERLRLVPLEAVVSNAGDVSFEIVPPWLKDVWLDPESIRTD